MTIVEEALYAFIKEGCAQKGEPYSRADFKMFRGEHEDELVQMKCALKAAGLLGIE